MLLIDCAARPPERRSRAGYPQTFKKN